MIESHGGEVHVSSEGTGGGTEFSFWLPQAAAVLPPPTPAAPGPAAGRPLRILIVEDNKDAARTLRILLMRSGHEVTLAHTGKEGVVAARDRRPDVVLCDLGLPEMDGFEVARTLRREPETASCHLIAVSGYGQDDDRRRCKEVGFDLHLTKPVDPAELHAFSPPSSGTESGVRGQRRRGQGSGVRGQRRRGQGSGVRGQRRRGQGSGVRGQRRRGQGSGSADKNCKIHLVC